MGDLELYLNWPQTQARRAFVPGATVVLPWGRGVGKSQFQRLMWWLAIAELDGRTRVGCRDLKGVRIILLAPTRKQAVDIHAKKIEQELGGAWAFLGGNVNKASWRIDFPGGSWVQMFGSESADSIRGLRCDIVSIDECDDVDSSAYDAVVLPWLSEPWSLKQRILGGTARRGRYGLLYRMHTMGLDNVGKVKTFPATYRDAPEHVDASFVEEVKSKTPPEIFAREWECNFDAGEGLVYSMFLRDFHVRLPDPYMRWREVIIGVDHGYEDPGVMLVVGVAGSSQDVVCHVLEEFYQTKQVESWWITRAQELAARYPGAKWYADPSMPARIEALRRGAKIMMLGADNAIEDGVHAVADKLFVRFFQNGDRYARLYVAPRCTNLIREFGMYRRKRDPKDKERVLDSIDSANDHALDALRYAIFSHFGAPPEPLRVLPEGVIG